VLNDNEHGVDISTHACKACQKRQEIVLQGYSRFRWSVLNAMAIAYSME
jgi:hypothetical protein